MAYRDPVVVNVSYFYVHVAHSAIRDAQARRDATQGHAPLPDAHRDVRETVLFSYLPLCSSPCYRRFSAQLEPEKVRAALLCMDSYKWL